MIKFLKSATLTIVGVLAGIAISLIIIVSIISVALVTTMGDMTVSAKAETVLEINMDETITNTPTTLDIEQILGLNIASGQITLFDMMRAIELAATDPNIVAISLKMDGLSAMSLSTAHQLRRSLAMFRANCDKPIYAYADDYSQTEYYVSSIADSIFVHPLGSIEWRGVAMSSLYYGQLFEQLGIECEVFRPTECIYKSAVEPYTRSNMSEQSRSQSQRIVDQIWERIVSDVARSRNIWPDRLREIACDEVLIGSAQATTHRMITRSIYAQEYDQLLAQQGAATDDESPRTLTLAQYSYLLDETLLDTDGRHIALIYADGVIGVEADDYSGVNAQRLSKLLRQAAADKDVQAVVIRVDSPGGGAIASDVVAREVIELQRRKLVVVSMGSVAASGGYYISTPADAIFADPFTITGSIGVYGLSLDISEVMQNRLHLHNDGVASSPSADFGSITRAIKPSERRALMQSVDKIYDEFTHLVATTRNLAPNQIDTLSQGRVWSADDALQGGLVDGIGGLQHTLAYTMEQLGGEIIPIREWLDESYGWSALFTALNAKVAASLNPMPQSFGHELKMIASFDGGLITYTPLRMSM